MQVMGVRGPCKQYVRCPQSELGVVTVLTSPAVARKLPYQLAALLFQATCSAVPVACGAPRETARRVNPGCQRVAGAEIETHQRLLDAILDLIAQNMRPLSVVCGDLCGDRIRMR